MTTKPRSGAASVEEQDPEAIPAPPSDAKPGAKEDVPTVRLRLAPGLPNVKTFAYPHEGEHIEVDADGSDVPADLADEIIKSAAMSGFEVAREDTETGEEA